MDIIDKIIKNIKLRMKDQNITQSEIAEKLGFSVQYMSDMMRRVRGGLGSVETLEKLGKILDVPLIYFFKDGLQENRLSENSTTYDFIKFYDAKVSAGTGVDMENETFRLLPVEKSFINKIGYSSSMLSVTEVYGDSMEPTFRNGDYVIILNKDFQTGFVPGIYVIRDFSGLKVKRLDMDKKGTLKVTSDNLYYDPQTYTQEELNAGAVAIIGRVVGKLGLI